jgi:hypothetical protein
MRTALAKLPLSTPLSGEKVLLQIAVTVTLLALAHLSNACPVPTVPETDCVTERECEAGSISQSATYRCWSGGSSPADRPSVGESRNECDGFFTLLEARVQPQRVEDNGSVANGNFSLACDITGYE